MSHQAIYVDIVEKNIPYAVILEDDVIVSPDLPLVLNALEAEMIDNKKSYKYLITLERCDVYKKKNIQQVCGIYKKVSPYFIREGSIAQSAGYIITHEAAKTMSKINKPVFFPADSWGYYKKQGIIFFGLIPSMKLIRQNNQFNSTTQNEKRLNLNQIPYMI